MSHYLRKGQKPDADLKMDFACVLVLAQGMSVLYDYCTHFI